MLDCMEEHGLEPNATLWHFVHPTWFDDLGGFTKEANIVHFVEWSKTAYRLFGQRIKLWATFNEPSVRPKQHASGSSAHPHAGRPACSRHLHAVHGLSCAVRHDLRANTTASGRGSGGAGYSKLHPAACDVRAPRACMHAPAACTQCAMFLGWVVGIAPPGRIMDLIGAGHFLSNMLKAHLQVRGRGERGRRR